jgi:hydrogenase-4 component B
MMPVAFLLTGCGLHLLAGLLAVARRGLPGTAVSVVAVVASACLGVAGVWALAEPSTSMLQLPWLVPGGGISIGVDALSAVFLLPIAVLGGACSIYARAYWDTQPSGRRTRAAVAVLLVGMVLVVTAGQGLWFLVCWETMALAAWVAMAAEHRKREVRQASWIYLVFTHLGTACLLAMVVLLALRSGSYEWLPCAGAAHHLDGAIALLAIIGFGAKAGLVPLHAWLPGAHASAPSHVSALLSGVMLNTGIYGILRVTGLLPEPAVWWGTLLVVIGALTAVYGIASAVTQADYKRLLACSSIENLGIITLAVGLALVARAQGRNDLALLAGGAALLHVWHHAIFKGLLFCAAGAILQATRTRRMDRLGGLFHAMPRTGAVMLLGCTAAAGLPGLAGFASEWPLYCAGFSDLRSGGWIGLVVVVALALCGALAVAAYAGLFGGVLLGAARSPDAAQAHDPAPSMIWPMIALAVTCCVLPLALPWTLASLTPALGIGLRISGPAPHVPGLAWLAGSGLVLALLGGGLWWWLRRTLAQRPSAQGLTWDCGYAAPTARMQYTVSSFGAPLGRDLAPAPIRPPSDSRHAVGLFPALAHFATHGGDGMLDRWILPLVARFNGFCQYLRLLQQGSLHAYLGYILLAVLALLAAALYGAA